MRAVPHFFFRKSPFAELSRSFARQVKLCFAILLCFRLYDSYAGSFKDYIVGLGFEDIAKATSQGSSLQITPWARPFANLFALLSLSFREPGNQL